MKSEYDLSRIQAELKISSKPTERDILKIIDFVKQIEMASRIESEKELIRHYTHFACFDLAKIIKLVYKNCDNINVMNITSAFPTLFSRTISDHYLIEFNDKVYDINGSHTIEEAVDYCKMEYGWRDGKCKVLSKEDLERMGLDLSAKKFKDPLIGFCLNKITLKNTTNLEKV